MPPTDKNSALADEIERLIAKPPVNLVCLSDDQWRAVMDALRAPRSSERTQEGETPRTDAEVVRRNYGHDMIPADFARQLERELDGLAAMYRAAVKMIEEAPLSATSPTNSDAARMAWLIEQGATKALDVISCWEAPVWREKIDAAMARAEGRDA